jgi:predicted ribosomally synthesized peptide with SipW-like signal peptide
MSKGRRLLYGLLAVGLIGLGAGGGTFATFNASTTNAGNTFTTGTLYLSNTVNSGTTCFSYNDNASGANNDAGNSVAPNGCTSVINVTKNPGQTATATVTIANQGTIGATALDLFAPTACADVDPAVTVTTADITSTTQATISGGWAAAGVSAGEVVSGAGVATLSPTVVSTAGGTLVVTGGTLTPGAGSTLTFTSASTTTHNPLCNSVVTSVELTNTESATGSTATPNTTYFGHPAYTQTEINALWSASGWPGTPYVATTDSLAGLTAYTSGAPLAVGALAAGQIDTFAITFDLPDPTASQNTLMGLQSNFSLTWQATQ